MHRTSGILLHPTSLPGPFGIGDLGPAAYEFVDFLAASGQGLWQVLPLGPTGFGDSPYQCPSSFAGNPLLISPERLLELGWIDAADLEHPDLPAGRVDFGAVRTWKRALLGRAYQGFLARGAASDREDLARFREHHRHWLEDYALYTAIKLEHGMRPWTEWPEPLALREPKALSSWAKAQRERIERQVFVQYLFFRQWSELRRYAHERGVHVVGDIPIFVAHDSSEVWTHRDWFELDPHGHPTVIAGVPPDYFSATGQRWGNPLYRWPALAASGYRFWVERLRHVLEMTDLVRVDHFRGFAGYWEIPASEATAVHGRWVPGPGMALFEALKSALGEELPLIAEDLGVITPDVEALRDGLGLPGMAILQFAFEDTSGGFGRSEFLPHNHRRRLAVYTGTHDNNTLLGWWATLDPTLQHHARRYLNSDAAEIQWDFIRAALASVADLALFPMQDILGLGPEACMNRPGISEGNWVWRYTRDQLDADTPGRLLELTRLYGRLPYPV
jgi:4-alpha-glucanotransferase